MECGYAKMSIPKIPSLDPSLTRDQAINAILMSIAAEETALSHLIDAESKKIQYANEHLKLNKCADIQKLVDVNRSVESLIERINEMQRILKEKMHIALDHKQHPSPKPPCPPPKPICRVSKIVVDTRYVYCKGSLLSFDKALSHVSKGVAIRKEHCGMVVDLPACKEYKIEYCLKLLNRLAEPVCIKIALRCCDEIIHSEDLSKIAGTCHVTLAGKLFWKTRACPEKNVLTIRLMSPERLEVTSGTILITEIEKALS